MTDSLDATALADKLDRYARGNTTAFTPITVPTPEQENRRAEGRLREQLKRTRHQGEARGRSLQLFKDRRVTGRWWTERHWQELQPTLPALLVQELALMRTLLLQFDAQEQPRRQATKQTTPEKLKLIVAAEVLA